MKKKKALRTVVVLVLIQLVMVIVFVHMLMSSQQININDTKQIDIIVDNIYNFRVAREYRLYVVSNSTKYLFVSPPTFEEYSVDELYRCIAKGDELSLRYYEAHDILGKVNMVVDARSETEIYRNIEGYNRAKQGLPTLVIILFSIIELIYVGIVFIYVWLKTL